MGLDNAVEESSVDLLVSYLEDYAKTAELNAK